MNYSFNKGYDLKQNVTFLQYFNQSILYIIYPNLYKSLFTFVKRNTQGNYTDNFLIESVNTFKYN